MPRIVRYVFILVSTCVSSMSLPLSLNPLAGLLVSQSFVCDEHTPWLFSCQCCGLKQRFHSLWVRIGDYPLIWFQFIAQSKGKRRCKNFMLITLLANTQGLTITLLFKNPMMHAGHQRGRKGGRIQVIRNNFVHTCLRGSKHTSGELSCQWIGLAGA